MADTELNALTAATAATGGILYGEQSGASRKFTSTAAGASLLEAANAAAQRTALGLGTMATQAASAVAVTGGTLAGVKLSSLTSNGVVTTSGGDGTLSVTGTSTGGNGAADDGKVVIFNSTGAASFGKLDAVSTLITTANAPGGSALIAHQYGSGGYVITSFSHANSLGGFHHLGNGINENAVEAVFATTAQGCVGLAVDFDSSGGHATAIGMDLYMAGLGTVLNVDSGFYTISALGIHNFLSTTPAANATAITVNSATHTASAPAFSAVQTWNNGAVTFEALKLNVTNTASAAASTLLDLQVGAASKFKVGVDGTTSLANGSVLNLYNTSDQTTNYERLGIDWSANVCRIATRKGGSGTARDLQISCSDLPGYGFLYLKANGNFGFGTTNPGYNYEFAVSIGFSDGAGIGLGTTTGTKLATATNQMLGFWGATPVVQQVLATGGGATVDNVITFLQTLGLCKQS